MSCKPLVLVILDGFGVAPDDPRSSWRSAKLPIFERLAAHYPFTTLSASGISVGLGWDQEGNSEVGHLTIGAGRILYQYLSRINNAIKDGSFFETKTLQSVASHIHQHKSRLHIAGLFSSGTVHAFQDHVYALLEFAKRNDVDSVFLHLFTDGKDAFRHEAIEEIQKLQKKIEAVYPFVRIASVSGRFFAMDRDDNWERTQKAYKALVGKSEIRVDDLRSYFQKNYENGITDESIEPAIVVGADVNPVGSLSTGDALIFFNFREDSMRQIVSPFAEKKFNAFKISIPENLFVATMTLYYSGLDARPIFSPPETQFPLAEILSVNKLKQFHIAETQKYAHVTYFFDGAREKPFAQEEWVFVPSSKVENFADAPEMSAAAITTKILEQLPNFDVVVANYANADMVGHSGDFEATVQALEVLDGQIGVLEEALREHKGVLLVTADHGNAEEKRYAVTAKPKSKHSMNPVPFYLVGEQFKLSVPRLPEEARAHYKKTDGILADIAPTILELLEIPKPKEMTGVSLLHKLLDS